MRRRAKLRIGLKRVVLLVTSLAVAGLIGEGILHLYIAVSGAAEWRAVMDAARAEARIGSAGERVQPRGVSLDLSSGVRATRWEVLHPYLGYVENPEIGPGGAVSRFGFPGPELPADAPGNAFVVWVFGGSVAAQVATTGSSALASELERLGVGAGRPVFVVNRGVGGYKQPQQVFALLYLLAVGPRVDLVVSLDGFNEVALPPRENVASGVASFYPRSWPYRVQLASDPAVQGMIGRISVLREERQRWVSVFDHRLLRHSELATSVWAFRDQRLAYAILDLQLRLQSHRPGRLPYVATGPARAYPSDEAMYADLVEIWRRSSVLMADLCRARGIPYHQFLQPNQYVPGSKPFSDREKRIAFSTSGLFRPHVEAAYGRLREVGATLVAEGVGFHDLTLLFARTESARYADDCCHFNEEGCVDLARAMARAIAASAAPAAAVGGVGSGAPPLAGSP